MPRSTVSPTRRLSVARAFGMEKLIKLPVGGCEFVHITRCVCVLHIIGSEKWKPSFSSSSFFSVLLKSHAHTHTHTIWASKKFVSTSHPVLYFYSGPQESQYPTAATPPRLVRGPMARASRFLGSHRYLQNAQHSELPYACDTKYEHTV